MSQSAELRLAMWSGPRNISTAMMRSWGNRDDCIVIDEPLYAHYLAVTGKPHPGADEVIAAGNTDWRKVVEELTQSTTHAPRAVMGDQHSIADDGSVPTTIFYQKHMTHHLLPHMGREWLADLTHAFLIRHPREVLASYVKIVETPELEDTGFPQQAELFEWAWKHTGRVPPVIDAADVLRDPRRVLELLCDALGVPFQEAMLTWPAGPRPTDGVWARHWYSEVEKSTGFRPYQPRHVELPEWLEAIYSECLEDYELLYPHRLK